MCKPPGESLIVIAALSVLVLLNGCGADLAAPAHRSGAGLDQQRRAVSLYVDATMLSELNEHDKAIQKLDSAVQLDSQFALAWSLKGDIYQTLGQYDQSAQAYEAATTLDPWSFKDFFNLGKVTQVMKQFTRAARAYGTACELEPSHYESHLNIARCYYELGDYDNAVRYGQMARKMDAGAADPEVLLGDVLGARNEHRAAIDAYRRALELEGNQPRIMVPLAASYLRTENFEAAQELLAAAIQLDPTNAMAHQYLGFAWLKLKEVDRAIASYETAAQIAPADWMARKGLGVAYILKATMGGGEMLRTQGLSQWRRSLDLNPDQPDLQQLYDKYAGQQVVSP